MAENKATNILSIVLESEISPEKREYLTLKEKDLNTAKERLKEAEELANSKVKNIWIGEGDAPADRVYETIGLDIQKEFIENFSRFHGNVDIKTAAKYLFFEKVINSFDENSIYLFFAESGPIERTEFISRVSNWNGWKEKPKYPITNGSILDSTDVTEIIVEAKRKLEIAKAQYKTAINSVLDNCL